MIYTLLSIDSLFFHFFFLLFLFFIESRSDKIECQKLSNPRILHDVRSTTESCEYVHMKTYAITIIEDGEIIDYEKKRKKKKPIRCRVNELLHVSYRGQRFMKVGFYEKIGLFLAGRVLDPLLLVAMKSMQAVSSLVCVAPHKIFARRVPEN